MACGHVCVDNCSVIIVLVCCIEFVAVRSVEIRSLDIIEGFSVALIFGYVNPAGYKFDKKNNSMNVQCQNGRSQDWLYFQRLV